MSHRTLPILVLFAGLSGCKPLLHDPWALHGAGKHAVGVSTGWTWTSADVRLDPTSVDGPIDEEDSVTIAPDTTYVAAARYEYFLTDNWMLGTRIEWRGFHGETFELADRDIARRSYDTMLFAESLRYLFEPIGEQERWRPFAGAELAYVPELDFRADVSGPDGDSPEEKIRFRGSGYYSLGVSAGASYLWSDDTILEIGALYEWPFGTSEEEITFGDPTDPTSTDWEIEPEGLILFVSLLVSY